MLMFTLRVVVSCLCFGSVLSQVRPVISKRIYISADSTNQTTACTSTVSVLNTTRVTIAPTFTSVSNLTTELVTLYWIGYEQTSYSLTTAMTLHYIEPSLQVSSYIASLNASIMASNTPKLTAATTKITAMGNVPLSV